MKAWEKAVYIGIAGIIGMIVTFGLSAQIIWSGVMDFSRTTVDTETSPNGKYTVTLQQIGSPEFPFGSVTAKITLKNEKGKKIESVKGEINNDGGSLYESQWELDWQSEKVLITVRGADGDIYNYSMQYE